MFTPEYAASLVDRLYRRLADRRPLFQSRFEYVNGEHPLTFATDEWRKFHGDRYKGFSDNWCAPIAQAPVDRLRVDGFRLGGSTNTGAAERELWADWQRNEMTAQSSQGFFSTVTASRSAIMVWFGAGGMPEVTWERADQVVFLYDATGRKRRAALKVWVEDDLEYATLYEPDAIWKYQRPAAMSERTIQAMQDRGFELPSGFMSSGGFIPREVRNETWPMHNPLGVLPLVELPNRPRIGMEPVSDIDGAIAMQNAINASWSYLFAAADYASMTPRVVIGGQPPTVPILDENGEVIGGKPAKLEDLAKGRLLFLPGATGIAQWDAAKSEYFTTIIRQAIAHLAAQSRTPGHYFLNNDSMANLNGDALTAAEVPLVTKCEAFQVHASPAIKEVAALMAQIRNQADLAASIRASDSRRFVQWKDAAMHSLAQVADAATKDRAVGMSLRTVLERRYGMTDEQIDQEMERIATERSLGVTADPAALAAASVPAVGAP